MGRNTNSEQNFRSTYRDAVKDHGPQDPVLRLVLLLLADFFKPDRPYWATISVLARQSGLPQSSVRERLQQLDGTWFRRETRGGRRYFYTLHDPGPGASIPSVVELRRMRREGGSIDQADSAATATQIRRHGDENSATPAAPRRIETSKDSEPNVRPLARRASGRWLTTNDPATPPPGTILCHECGSVHVEAVGCRFCARNQPQRKGVAIGDRVEVV